MRSSNNDKAVDRRRALPSSLPAMAQSPVVGPATCEAKRAVYEVAASDTDEVWRVGLVPRATWPPSSPIFISSSPRRSSTTGSPSPSPEVIPAYLSFPSPTPIRIAHRDDEAWCPKPGSLYSRGYGRDTAPVNSPEPRRAASMKRDEAYARASPNQIAGHRAPVQ